METLAHFRPDPAIIAEYEQIATLEGEEETPPPGLVPLAWCRGRMISKGVATEIEGDFVALGAVETLAELRPQFAARAVHYGLPDLDASSIRTSIPRAFTQELSSHIEAQRDPEGNAYAGIYYRSRHGDEIEDWALFERAAMNDESPVLAVDREIIDPDDNDLQRALEVFRLELYD